MLQWKKRKKSYKYLWTKEISEKERNDITRECG